MEKNPEDPNHAAMKRSAELFDFLGDCSDSDICELYNSSAFNDITKGYARLALKNTGFDDEQIKMVMDEIRYLHDTKRASEVL
jgi:hypothetical protein